MRERVVPYGGSVRVHSQPGAGTQVVTTISKRGAEPVQQAQDLTLEPAA